ncbi:MAG: hypothetical protein A2147_09660 [Chloroflexi bacterium RBG_16_57_8]|nr:MAG: hypothetical protein A2147_09660 [Chloroflexi bacterium RBG_16_57_8]
MKESGPRLSSISEFRTYRRNLPHWEEPGRVYFITFTAVDGFALIDSAKDIVFSSIKFHADKLYRLHVCVVMDAHVHSMWEPLPQPASQPGRYSVAQASLLAVSFYSLGQITHSIKSYSANRIQRAEDARGSVWLHENYDRIIRDEHEYLATLTYITDNPVKAGLVGRPEDYRWLFVDGGIDSQAGTLALRHIQEVLNDTNPKRDESRNDIR